MDANNTITESNFLSIFEIVSRDNFIDWNNPPGDFSASSEEIVKSLFEGIFAIEAFDFAVVAATRGGLLGLLNANSLPSFCLYEKLARRQLSSLVKNALKGSELIVSVICKFEDISYVFDRAGWVISNEKKANILEDINKNWQKEAVSIATRFCSGGVFFFSHDADPIYFLSRA